MTVQTTITQSHAVGNDLADTFNFGFQITSKEDLLVVVKDTTTTPGTPIETVLALDSDYSVTGVGNENGGSITLTAGPLTDGWEIDIFLNVDLTQEISFENQGSFFPKAHEAAFDKLTRIAQFLSNKIDRAVMGGISIVTDVIPLVLGYLADAVTPGRGAAMLGDRSPEASSVATNQREINSRVVHLSDFLTLGQKLDIKTGLMLTDCTAAWNAAVTAAAAKLIGTTQDTYDEMRYLGGCDVQLPWGRIRCDGKLLQKQGVGLRGSGVIATILQSSYDGRILTTPDAGTGSNYSMVGINARDFSIIGDRTKPNQIGVALLRPLDSRLQNMRISGCGSHGIVVRQGGLGIVENVHSNLNVGCGVLVTDGFNSWNDQTGTAWPTNFMRFVSCTFGSNDGPGIRAQGAVNGVVFENCNPENNYKSAGDNQGYNIEILTSSNQPIEFNECWVEGPVKAHIYVNCTSASIPVRLTHLKHFGNGAAGNVDRCAIIDKGTLYIDGAFGHATAYKTINGSKSPFRINKAGGAALVRAKHLVGSTLADNDPWFEDETGAHTGLYNYLWLEQYTMRFGDWEVVGANSGKNLAVRNEAKANPFIILDSYTKGVLLSVDGGDTAPSVQVRACWNTPEGSVTAPVGSICLRGNGGANTTLYVKESGTGNTGWVAK